MKYYHITKQIYLHHILNEGLKVNTNNSGFIKASDITLYYNRYNMQPIFLTSNPKYHINTQLTQSWLYLHNPYIITLDLHCEFENEYDYLNKDLSDSMYNKRFKSDKQYSYISRTNIHQCYIASFKKIPLNYEFHQYGYVSGQGIPSLTNDDFLLQ